ncbi:MAG TPA: energy transducer TonB [Usitatibacter sp.]|nr:energy transducer TonB [Usitatibacter sp.]
MGGSRLAGAFALLAGLAAAQEPARDPLHLSDPALWGRVKRIVEPEFPRAALVQGRSGYVDVRGRVSPVGSLEEVEYSPEDATSGVFIDPIRRVLRHWEFQPPLGRDCQPSEERVTNRVWFESRDGRPHVSVSLVRPDASRLPPTVEPLHREDPIYPSSMRRSGDQAVVYTRVLVDPAGSVVSVEPHAYPRRRGQRTREFEQEVIRALSQWKYPPAPEAAGDRHVCFDIWFRLSG